MDFSLQLTEGQVLTKSKLYEKAEDWFKSMVYLLLHEEDTCKRNQVLSEAYNNLGYICYKKVEFKKAVQYYDESIKLNNSYGVAYYNRGTIQYRLGFYESALEDMKQAILHTPENSEFQFALKECEFALKLVSKSS